MNTKDHFVATLNVLNCDTNFESSDAMIEVKTPTGTFLLLIAMNISGKENLKQLSEDSGK